MTYREDVKTTMGAGGIAAIVVVIVLVIGGAIWGGSVLLSNATGAGGAIKQRNSALNRVQQQEQFEQLAADYDGYLVKVRVARAAVKAAAGDPVNLPLRKTELEGLQQTCIDTAQQFNANSRKYTARAWKSAGLPPTLDPDNCTGAA